MGGTQRPPTPTKSVGDRLYHVSLGLVALAILLVLTGTAYQITGNQIDRHRFPQTGKAVQVAGVNLNLDCSGDRMGTNSPEVILDSGMGVPAIGWFKVQPEVAKFARVCSYDRAGYGWSDAGPQPRTSMEIAQELKALLEAAGEKSPYVLVGHSFGGFNVRIFTKLYPADVFGIVLVEGAHEDEDERVNDLLPASVVEQESSSDLWSERMDRVLEPLEIHLGVQRLQVATGWGSPQYGVLMSSRMFSKDFREELLFLRQQSKFENAVASESDAFSESKREVRVAGDLGNRPLIVLTAGKPYPPDPVLTAEQTEARDNLWINVLQVQEEHLSTRGKQIIVADSDHMIPFKRPDVVVSAIHEVWSEALNSSTPN